MPFGMVSRLSAPASFATSCLPRMSSEPDSSEDEGQGRQEVESDSEVGFLCTRCGKLTTECVCEPGTVPSPVWRR